MFLAECSRRDILRGFALGGMFIAGELWIPGQRLISIPKLIETGQTGSGVMTRAEFAAMMQEGLNESFEEVYAALEPKWAAIKISVDETRSQLRMRGITHDELYRV